MSLFEALSQLQMEVCLQLLLLVLVSTIVLQLQIERHRETVLLQSLDSHLNSNSA